MKWRKIKRDKDGKRVWPKRGWVTTGRRGHWLWRFVRRLGCLVGLCGGVCRDGAWRCSTCGKTLNYHDN